MPAKPIAKDFPDFSEDEWRALVAKSTKGQTPSDLAAKTDDGIPVGPLYGQRSGGAVIGGRGAAPWKIVQRVDHPNFADANEQMRVDLGGGADAIELVFATSPLAHGAGLPTPSDADIDRLLSGLPPDTRMRVDAGEETPSLGPRIASYGFGVTLAFDPIATLAARGWLSASYADIGKQIATATREMERAGREGATTVADGRVWHAAGASEVQELAAVIAGFAAHLRLFERHEISFDIAARRIGVALAADADQFLTIAKFRAVRLLTARLLEAAQVDAKPVPVHAETAWRMMSRRDPHVNILRATTAAFAAGIGGADSVTVLPFTIADGVADAFARRLAWSSQTILIAESHLADVTDPAAGSGAVEALTSALAERAWEKFRKIESTGGLLSVVRAGSLQREIAELREARLKRAAAGETPLVGASLFPADGALPSISPPSPPIADLIAAERAEPLVFKRLSEIFE